VAGIDNSRLKTFLAAAIDSQPTIASVAGIVRFLAETFLAVAIDSQFTIASRG
jgi:hypothetical protein